MSNWKCEICGKEFENFQAQGFDNKVYCPLCFFKEKINRLEKIRTQLKEENQQLKEKYKIRSEAYNKVLLENASLKEENSQLKQDYELYKDNFIYRNYEVEIRDNTIKQLKDVIEEVREYAKSHFKTMVADEEAQGLLQILDKAGSKND